MLICVLAMFHRLLYTILDRYMYRIHGIKYENPICRIGKSILYKMLQNFATLSLANCRYSKEKGTKYFCL